MRRKNTITTTPSSVIMRGLITEAKIANNAVERITTPSAMTEKLYAGAFEHLARQAALATNSIVNFTDELNGCPIEAELSLSDIYVTCEGCGRSSKFINEMCPSCGLPLPLPENANHHYQEVEAGIELFKLIHGDPNGRKPQGVIINRIKGKK